MRKVLLPLLVLVALAPLAQAHGAAPPRAQDTRLLHDHNDDCGGDGITSNCRGTIDLIALDVQELYEGGEKVNFRFTLDKGQSGSQKLTLSYDSPAGKKTFETTTTDQTTFTGGFDKLTVSSAGDGTRYILDAQTTSDKAGLTGRISNFRVEARKDNTLGDFMPGGYQSALGAVQDPAQGDGPTNYVKPDYAPKGSSYYVVFSGPDLSGSGKAKATLQVGNLLDAAQTVTIRLTTTAGEANFVGGGTEKVIDIARKGSMAIDVEVSGASEGRVTLTATTSLGGRTVQERGFAVTEDAQPGGSDTQTTQPTDDSQDQDSGSKDSPAPAFALLAIGLLLLARRGR